MRYGYGLSMVVALLTISSLQAQNYKLDVLDIKEIEVEKGLAWKATFDRKPTLKEVEPFIHFLKKASDWVMFTDKEPSVTIDGKQATIAVEIGLIAKSPTVVRRLKVLSYGGSSIHYQITFDQLVSLKEAGNLVGPKLVTLDGVRRGHTEAIAKDVKVEWTCVTDKRESTVTIEIRYSGGVYEFIK